MVLFVLFNLFVVGIGFHDKGMLFFSATLPQWIAMTMISYHVAQTPLRLQNIIWKVPHKKDIPFRCDSKSCFFVQRFKAWYCWLKKSGKTCSLNGQPDILNNQQQVCKMWLTERDFLAGVIFQFPFFVFTNAEERVLCSLPGKLITTILCSPGTCPPSLEISQFSWGFIFVIQKFGGKNKRTEENKDNKATSASKEMDLVASLRR